MIRTHKQPPINNEDGKNSPTFHVQHFAKPSSTKTRKHSAKEKGIVDPITEYVNYTYNAYSGYLFILREYSITIKKKRNGL